MTSLADALRDPIALAPNRIPRFYRGGRALDELRGGADPRDDGRPEDWVGSATPAWTPPEAQAGTLGLSTVELNGRSTTLAAVLRDEPEALVGAAMLERTGPSLGLLVKLLDAGERLPVHWHPTREAAARHLGSRFGKTEAWLVLGTRDGRPARVWAGLREAVDAPTWRSWVESQALDAMRAALVEHVVEAGDAILVPGGMPHAIDAGCLILELQEPTDFSIVAEQSGFPITAADASLRLGWELAARLVVTEPAGALRQSPEKIGPGVDRLLGPGADPFFRAMRQRLDGSGRVPHEPSFGVALVLGGSGEVAGATGALRLRRGVTFALPAAAAPHARLVGDGLELIWCLPPTPEALDAAPLPEIGGG